MFLTFGFVTTASCIELIIAIVEIVLMIKRLHDTDRSGWNCLWALLPIAGPIILIVYCCQPGTPGPNRFGDPNQE